MKNNQTILIITVLILAGSMIACSMFGGSNSNVANNSNNSITTNADTPTAAKTEDLPMLSAPKLLEMLVADPAGLNERLKDKEIIVLGVVKGASLSTIKLEGGPATIKTVYCSMDTGGSEAAKQSYEKFQKLEALSYYPRPPKPPIAEVKCVFGEGSVFKENGIPSASIYLNKCILKSTE